MVLYWLFPTENDHISGGCGAVAGSHYRSGSGTAAKIMSDIVWVRRELRVSNSGAINCFSATLVVGTMYTFGKGFSYLFSSGVRVCVFSLSGGLTWGVFVCIWSYWVCVVFFSYSAALASGCCWTNKAELAVSSLHTVWAGVWSVGSILMHPVH